jgi:predicted ATPase/DNA-binding SARP family transcriptional activator
MAQRLELTLFGSPEVCLAGKPLTGFRSAKTQALLYYVAVTGRAQPRSTLAGLFWGDVGDYYARRNLNRTLSNLTQLVGEHLVSSRQTLAFDKSQPYWLDVEQLETALNAPPAKRTPTALATALQSYRGDFLDGFYIHDAPEFEQWVLTERTRLRERYLQGLLTLAALQTEAGDLISAGDTMRRALQLEPWREETHRQLIANLAQQGQRSAALAQFDLCRQALASELSVEPDAATLALVARIRAGEFDKVTARLSSPQSRGQGDNGAGSEERAPNPQPATGDQQSPPGRFVTPSSLHPVILSPPHNLPLQATPFVGRVLELSEIERLLLEDGDCRLLTLVGPGGMGKTRLAIKTMERLVEHATPQSLFADGIFFVSLEAVQEAYGMVSAVVSVIAEESGFPLHVAAPLLEQLLDFLRPKKILLVLDNFEHLIKDVVLLSTMLRAAPGLKLLVTSREALGLQEAWFYPLTGLSVPRDEQDRSAHEHEHDAVRFFMQCARRTQPTFAFATERSAVVRICQLVEGMPLAIELAAAWLKVLTCQQVAQEIERGLDILTTRFQNLPARHRSMRAVMEQSWQMLAVAERSVAARLSVFRGPFSQEAAHEVTGASLPTLAGLVEKALLRVHPDRRYQMHELTRQYAAEQVGQLRDLRNMHSRYYAQFGHRLNQDLYGPQSKAALDEFTLVADNILAAWRWLVQAVGEGDAHRSTATWLAQIMAPLAEWYYVKAFFQTGRQLFIQAAETLAQAGWASAAAPPTPPAAEQTTYAQLQVRIAMLTYELGQYNRVVDPIERALPLLRAWGDAEEVALALVTLGKANYRRGRRSEARTQLQESLHLAQTAQNLLGQAMAFNNLAHIAQEEGEYAEAGQLYRQALLSYQSMAYGSGIAAMLGNLGYIYGLQGDYEQAQVHHRKALRLAEEQGDALTRMVSTTSLAAVKQAIGQIEAAIHDYQESLRLADEIGNVRWRAMNLNGLGRAHLALHDYRSATRHLTQGLTTAGRITSVVDVLDAFLIFAQVWMQQGQVNAALRALCFVEQHPVTTKWMHRETQTLLDELIAELPAEIVTQAKAWAAGQTWEEVAAWVQMIQGDI